MRDALAHVAKGQQSTASASLRQAFLQDTPEKAHAVRRAAAGRRRGKWSKLGAFMDGSEHDVLAHMGFPERHRARLHPTNPLERLNKEVKRRADVVGIFPSEQPVTGLIGAVLLERKDEWQLQHRYMQVEGMAGLIPPTINGQATSLPSAQTTPNAA